MQILYYLMLLGSILFATGNNVCYHQLANEGKYSRFLFTALSSAVWVVGLIPFINLSQINSLEIIFGVIYGVVQAMFLFFKMRAMSTGPISITSVVCNCSMLVTTLFGIIAYNERSSMLQFIGLAAILASVILCADPKSDMKKQYIAHLNVIFISDLGSAQRITEARMAARPINCNMDERSL